jgi:nitrogenase molybdenum-iron protein alpha/beta subunit
MERKIKTIDEKQAEIFMAFAKKRLKDNLQKIEYMTPELQRYYENRFDMMSREGWKDLMEDIDNMINSLNNISTIPDEKSLQFKKGELSILVWLKTLKQVSTQAYEELNEKNV